MYPSLLIISLNIYHGRDNKKKKIKFTIIITEICNKIIIFITVIFFNYKYYQQYSYMYLILFCVEVKGQGSCSILQKRGLGSFSWTVIDDLSYYFDHFGLH